MEHIFVADTNLFLECKKLEDISWSDLGVDPIVVVLTKPVIGEIDKHKKLGGRTRKRALAVSARIRSMLKSDALEEQIREQAPKVHIRLAPIARPDPGLTEVLDFSLNDDRIVGIVSAMTNGDASGPVCFLTDDSVAASTAQSVGVPFHFIEEGWKRPPEPTTEAKRIRELESDLEAYRMQEPVIVIRNATDEAVGANVVRRVALPLASAEVKTLVDRLRASHPMQTEFEVPEAETWEDGTEVTYRTPEPEDVDKYKAVAYPAWVSKCRSVLARLHENRKAVEPPLLLAWDVANNGTRPAVQVRITFVAEGNIHLRRPSTDDDTDGHDGDTSGDRDCSVWPSLPPPPKPPQARRSVQKPRVVLRKPTDMVVGKSLAGLRIGDLDQLDRIASVGSTLAGLTGRGEALLALERNRLDILAANLESEVHGRAQPLAMPPLRHLALPPKHDKETFYYDEWPSEQPVTSGALTCDLYRHQHGEEKFELEVVFPEDGNVHAAVVCTIHAENLTKPVSLRIPVSRSIEEYSLLNRARALIEDCGT